MIPYQMRLISRPTGRRRTGICTGKKTERRKNPLRYTIQTKNKKGKWKFSGMYTDKYIPQLINACIHQAKKGKQMYRKMRILGTDNGKTTVL